ncbi:MAG: hypothetical protein AVDCRST_MAG77-2952 [uncultured Chloroflexi bacterium]|uniref:DUF4267 domain-containing protein n=1 Tax=uncultured Chloroflexota bacterium TaxID=166587 RepID=A0A6J4IDN6_9CHLR|nr:MAG: hypothetical protein AVDCRST_MAG77-2952 [uncultured Chloroflexota bacterium]
MQDKTLRTLAKALGLGTAAFGIVPFFWPRYFSRLSGLADPAEPTTEAAYRSVGARDLAIGLGLWSAAAHGGKYAPWVLARLICDTLDTVAALLAIRRGERDPRFLGLTGMAAGAAAFGAWLWSQARAKPTQ